MIKVIRSGSRIDLGRLCATPIADLLNQKVHFFEPNHPPSYKNLIFGSFCEHEPLADLGHLPEYSMATDLKLLTLSCFPCSSYMNTSFLKSSIQR